ncbi:hypothetical protein F511_34586 [Dorcoceras hygrometricum]|uniref:Uncharacterized protein n=1 Tax=Dorcoceras hygrometricum TaxID=472368 RepID=A0A2Z7C745_9LAMI|nr:hypothetical protein F511_34586 [Dorcoceras hygrometricum]
MPCMRSRIQPNTGSKRIPKAAQQLESEQKEVATMCVSIWELSTRLSTRYQSQQGDEGRELPARLYKHPGTLNSAIKRHGYKRSETTCNRCVYAVQHNAAGNKIIYTSSENSKHKNISMPNLNVVTSLHPYLNSLCNNYYKLGPSNTDLTPAKPITNNYSRTETQKSNSWELRTRPALYYPSNSTKSSNKYKAESEHLPQQARTQARGFAAQTCILLKGAPDLELGESKEFPPLKILTSKTVGTYVAKNKNIIVEEVVNESVVKKAAPKRRLARAVGELVAIKKRNTVGRAAPAEKDLMMVPVVQDAEPISIVTAATPKAHRRRAPKRKLVLQKDPVIRSGSRTLFWAHSWIYRVGNKTLSFGKEPDLSSSISAWIDPVLSPDSCCGVDRYDPVIRSGSRTLFWAHSWIYRAGNKTLSVGKEPDLSSSISAWTDPVLSPDSCCGVDRFCVARDFVVVIVAQKTNATDDVLATMSGVGSSTSHELGNNRLSYVFASGSQICVSRDFVVVIVAQKTKVRMMPVGGQAGNSRIPRLPTEICFPCFSAGRGFDPAGGAPGGDANSDSSTSIPIDFVNEETADAQTSLPTAIVSSIDVTDAFGQLKASVDQISHEQVQTRFHIEKLKAALFPKISSLETAFLSISDTQDRTVLVNNDVLRKEMKAQKAALSQELDLIRKEVQDQKAALSNDLMEFRVQAQDTLTT